VIPVPVLVVLAVAVGCIGGIYGIGGGAILAPSMITGTSNRHGKLRRTSVSGAPGSTRSAPARSNVSSACHRLRRLDGLVFGLLDGVGLLAGQLELPGEAEVEVVQA
jgi:uncharacterized membrane protein YfcA